MKTALSLKLAELENRHTSVMKRRGEDAMNDGDGWHDGSFVSATTDAHAIMEQIRFLRKVASHLDDFVLPQNTDVVQVGHLVRLNLTDPDKSVHKINALVVPPGLSNIVKDSLGDKNVQPVAQDTELGKALLGSAKGSVRKYSFLSENYVVEVVNDADAITLYQPFRLLVEN